MKQSWSQKKLLFGPNIWNLAVIDNSDAKVHNDLLDKYNKVIREFLEKNDDK
jgi:hypothetical protein